MAALLLLSSSLLLSLLAGVCRGDLEELKNFHKEARNELRMEHLPLKEVFSDFHQVMCSLHAPIV